jgi:hypothetical protein
VTKKKIEENFENAPRMIIRKTSFEDVCIFCGWSKRV